MISYNGALIAKFLDPERVRAVVPIQSAVLKGEQVYVCKHTWTNVEKLRSLGYNPPSPAADTEWKYTGRYKPFKHQRKGTEFQIKHPRLFNLSDMGTGKTATCLWAAEYLLQKGVIKRILITCPLSVMHVWTEEMFTICPHRTSVTLHGSKQKRLQLLAEQSQFVIINHDGVAVIHEELTAAGFDLVIGDEASTYRNAGTKKYKIFRALTKSIARLWLLTGTPAPTAPTDVWALIKLVNPNAFAMSFGAFKELTMRKINQFIWIPKKEASDTIYKLMKPAIRFRKEDCIDLPPLTYTHRDCEMSVEQRKAFDQMRKVMVMEKQSGEKITAANACVKLIKLLQICCGVVKDDNEIPHYLDDAARLNLLLEVIHEAQDKAIVFVPFLAVMDKIKDFLDAAGVGCEIVNGSVSQGRREEIFNSFQRGTLPVLLAHPKTAAHGLTLTAAACIIWYAPIFSAELYQQGNARIHRPGQDKPCTVVHIGSVPLEWKLYEALAGKLRLQDVILREYEEVVK